MNTVKRYRASVVAALLLLLTWSSQSSMADEESCPFWCDGLLDSQRTYWDTNEQQIAKTIKGYQAYALYERLSICDYMVSSLLTTNRLRWVAAEDERKEKKHDLAMEIGRAAYIIERLTQRPIQVCADVSNPSELAKYKARIESTVSEWRSAEVARELSSKHPQDRETLRSKYAGRIVPGETTNEFVWVEMILLLEEWFPIGQSVTDLTFIVGSPPTVVKDEEIMYFFVDRERITLFRFHVVNGVILSVLLGSGRDADEWSYNIPEPPLARALGRMPAALFLMPVTNAEAEGSAHAEVEARDWEKYLLSESVRSTNAVKATFQRRAAEKYAEYEALALKYGPKAAWERTGMDKLSQYDVVSFTYKVGGRTVVTKQTRWTWMALFQGESLDGRSGGRELVPMITSIAANCFNSYTNHDFGRSYGPGPDGTQMFFSGATNAIDSGVTDWRDDVRATVHAGTIAFYGPKQKQDYRTNSSLRVPMDEESNREWFDDNGIAVKDRGKGKDSR